MPIDIVITGHRKYVCCLAPTYRRHLFQPSCCLFVFWALAGKCNVTSYEYFLDVPQAWHHYIAQVVQQLISYISVNDLFVIRFGREMDVRKMENSKRHDR